MGQINQRARLLHASSHGNGYWSVPWLSFSIFFVFLFFFLFQWSNVCGNDVGTEVEYKYNDVYVKRLTRGNRCWKCSLSCWLSRSELMGIFLITMNPHYRGVNFYAIKIRTTVSCCNFEWSRVFFSSCFVFCRLEFQRTHIGLIISPLTSNNMVREIEIYWTHGNYRPGDVISLYDRVPSVDFQPIFTMSPHVPDGIRKTGIQAHLTPPSNLTFVRQCLSEYSKLDGRWMNKCYFNVLFKYQLITWPCWGMASLEKAIVWKHNRLGWQIEKNFSNLWRWGIYFYQGPMIPRRIRFMGIPSSII